MEKDIFVHRKLRNGWNQVRKNGVLAANFPPGVDGFNNFLAYVYGLAVVYHSIKKEYEVKFERN